MKVRGSKSYDIMRPCMSYTTATIGRTESTLVSRLAEREETTKREIIDGLVRSYYDMTLAHEVDHPLGGPIEESKPDFYPNLNPGAERDERNHTGSNVEIVL